MYKYVFIAIVIVMLGYSCQKDNTYSGDAPAVSVSVDTLTFDTVFTSIGSATRFFLIYNDESEDITVDISLTQGNQSMFRLNVDGIPGHEVNDVLIKAHDSIYVFADVTVDPDQPLSVSPFVIEESLNITSGKTTKDVLMVAWGQNANYIPGTKRKGIFSLLSCDLGTVTWDDPKPYVVYGVLIIDSCELVLPQGTDIYIHGGIVKADSFIYNDGLIVVGRDGRLVSQGTTDEPVTFQGDRLERDYEDVAGQWSGIRFLSGSTQNIMTHTMIKNPQVGVRVDSAARLELSKVSIANASSAGIIGIHSQIKGSNVLVYHTASQSLLLTYGGDYSFYHSTFANYGNQSAAVHFDNFRCTDPPLCQGNIFLNPLKVRFKNCIFTGNDRDEVNPYDWTEGEDPSMFDYEMTNCAVTVDEILDPDLYPEFFNHCTDCLRLSFDDLLFLDGEHDDYRLDTMSVVIDKGIIIPEVNDDINGTPRDLMPDIGCFEFIK